MRLLLDATTPLLDLRELPADDGEPATALHDLYAAGWLERGGLRTNFVSSADGAATVAGLSEGLQTAGDNRIFAALRDLADVVVVASGTARTENYRPIVIAPQRAARRAAYGLPAQLPLAIVTPSLSLRPDDAVLAPTEGAPRPLILTGSEAGGTQLRSELAAVADVIDCGDEFDPHAARAQLRERGLTRMLCEGGPHLLAAFAAAEAMEEFCLSVPALLAGPGAGRIMSGAPWPLPRHLQLHTVLEEEGALFLRYRSVAAAL